MRPVDVTRGLAVAGVLTVASATACRDESPPAMGPGSSSGGGIDSDAGADVGSGPPPTTCPPGDVRPCYEGPFGTADVGRCRSGRQTCAADGSGWSACEGEVWPEERERCETPEDDDCDGSTVCAPTLEWSRPSPGILYRLEVGADGDIVGLGAGGGNVGGLEFFGPTLVEFGADGELRWSVSNFSAEALEFTGVAVDTAGNVTAVGRYQGAPSVGGGLSLPPAAGVGAFALRYDPDGEIQWAHGLRASGYFCAVVDGEGTTFVAGASIDAVIDDQPRTGTFFVAALDPLGAPRWITTGSSGGGVAGELMSITTNAAGEVVLGVVLSPFGENTMGGTSIAVEATEPVLVRLGADGSVRGHRRVSGSLPLGVGRTWVRSHAAGVTAAANVVVPDDALEFRRGLVLTPFDDALEPASTVLIGTDARMEGMDVFPDGSVLLGLSFSGQLELGSIGVAVPLFADAHVVAEVDAQGQARWLELLYGQSNSDVHAVAVAPDGGVLVAGDGGPGIAVGGERVVGRFIAKLRR